MYLSSVWPAILSVLLGDESDKTNRNSRTRRCARAARVAGSSLAGERRLRKQSGAERGSGRLQGAVSWSKLFRGLMGLENKAEWYPYLCLARLPGPEMSLVFVGDFMVDKMVLAWPIAKHSSSSSEVLVDSI